MQIIGILLIFFIILQEPDMDIQHKSYTSVIPQKSPNDKRSYEAVQLKNNLKILFVHDQVLEKSACSISVGIGSLQDPDSSLGLAHFLEHMLFMGSVKYPQHNEYSSFINLNSGMDNAYTSDLQTNYFFQVSNKAFPQAVQRITNFFTGALLTESCVEKQTQAVHEQYVLWTNDDNCRKWEILRQLAKGPYSRFSIGNKQTLGHPDIRKELVQFYQSQYSANRIKAVLSSSRSIQEMKKQLIPYFQEIKDKKFPEPEYEKSFEKDNVGKLVKMQSIKQETIMEFFWPVDDLRSKYKKHVDQYITHVLGHEGTGSLLSLLKQKEFASETTSYHHGLASQTMIGLEIKLTETGAENYEEVYNIVCDYMSSLKPEKQIFEEIKHKKQIHFRFKQKAHVYNYVSNISSKMQYMPLAELLNGKYIFEEFDEEYLDKILKQLNPFNLIVVYSNSQEIQGAITEKFLGGKYKIQALPERKTVIKEFKPLSRNPFIPLDVELKPQNKDTIIPRKISQNVLFLKDNHFKVCRGGVKIILEGMNKPTMRQFYTEYLDMLLKEITYHAETLHVQVHYEDIEGIQIVLFGFNDAVTKLVRKIGVDIVKLHTSSDSERIFNLALDKIKEDYQNVYLGQVGDIAETVMHNILLDVNLNIPEGIEKLKTYSYEEQTKQFLQFLAQCNVHWFFIGNFDQEQSIALAKQFEANLGTKKTAKDQKKKCKKLTQNVKHLTELQSEDISTSGCIIYYEAGQYSQKLYYTLQLLKNHVQEPFFNALRTQKQMAYFLTTSVTNNRGILGLYFILVSSSKDPQFIAQQIKAFNKDFMGRMADQITQEKLGQLKQSVKTRYSAPHHNLKSTFDFICRQIEKATFYWDRKSKEELDKQLSQITKQDIINLWERLSKFGLQIHVLAKNHEEQFRKNSTEGYRKFRDIKDNSEYHKDIVREITRDFYC